MLQTSVRLAHEGLVNAVSYFIALHQPNGPGGRQPWQKRNKIGSAAHGTCMKDQQVWLQTTCWPAADHTAQAALQLQRK